MKSTIFTLLIILLGLFTQAQNTYPLDIKIRDIDNNKTTSKTFYNINKPIILDFWRTDCAPCIDLLNSYKEVYREWQKIYGVKIIVVSTDKRINRKKALKMIKDNNWPFEFYFDTNETLFKEATKSNILPISIVYDSNFNVAYKAFGITPNFGYKLINGEISTERVRTTKSRNKPKNKYSNLMCDLTAYEKVLIMLNQ